MSHAPSTRPPGSPGALVTMHVAEDGREYVRPVGEAATTRVRIERVEKNSVIE